MLKTLKYTFKLRKTYKTNSVLYVLRQLPFVKKILPPSLSESKVLNFIATLIFLIWEIVAMTYGKVIYYFFGITGIVNLSDTPEASEFFLQTLALFTLVGMVLNVDFLSYRKDKQYALSIFKLNAKEYTLVDLFYSFFKTVVGTMPFILILGPAYNIPLWFCILVPFLVALGKFVYSSFVLKYYDETGEVIYAGKKLMSWIIGGGLAFVTFLLPLFEVKIPVEISMGIMILAGVSGLLCNIKILTYKNYTKINKDMISQSTMAMEKAKNRNNTYVTSTISEDVSVTSNKAGFEYLNDLFVKRHKKLLQKPTNIEAIVVIVLAVLLHGLFLVIGVKRSSMGDLFSRMIPYFSFLVFMLNRGGQYTTALFLNCDRSLLTFSFYKKKRNLLKLFVIRLREIIKVHLPVGLALSAFVISFLFEPGNSESIHKCLLVFLTIMAENAIFCIHHMGIYYLLQPFNVNTEIKNASYYAITFITYAALYWLQLQKISLDVFAYSCLGFGFVYALIISILVYAFAPKTFRIKA